MGRSLVRVVAWIVDLDSLAAIWSSSVMLAERGLVALVYELRWTLHADPEPTLVNSPTGHIKEIE